MTRVIEWNRTEKTAIFRSPRDVGDFVAKGEDPAFMICRMMVNAGWSDQEAVVIDERGVQCWLIHSIHGAARQYVPTREEIAERAAEAEAEKAKKAATTMEK